MHYIVRYPQWVIDLDGHPASDIYLERKADCPGGNLCAHLHAAIDRLTFEQLLLVLKYKWRRWQHLITNTNLRPITT